MERYVVLKVPIVLVLLATALVVPAAAGAQTPDPPPPPPEPPPAPAPPPAPDASFTVAPTTSPLTFQQVTLTATAPMAGHRYRWDLDNDGQFDDANGERARVTFQTPGPRTVSLRINPATGPPASTSQVLNVQNRPPRASISASPANPVTDQSVRFYGTADDRDGTIVSRAWELDQDGDFDDATGPEATRAFYSAGSYRIGFRVVDSAGAITTAWGRITVTARPSGAPPPPPSTGAPPATAVPLPPALAVRPPVYRVPPLMSPFPFVRVAGYLQRDGARLTLVLIRGPRGANVRIRCSHSRRCPYRTRRARIGRSRRLRVRSLQRFLPAGLRLELSVTQPNRIGKRVTYRIRRGRLPVRWDGCIVPGWKRAMRCS